MGKAKPSIKSGGATQYPWPSQPNVRDEAGDRQEQDDARGQKVDSTPQGPPAKERSSDAQATPAAEAIPRSRYKAPPSELSTPSRPPPAQVSPRVPDDAWGGSSGPPPKSATPGNRVKAPPCYSGATPSAAASPAPSAVSTP